MRVPAHPCASIRPATSGGRTRSSTAWTSRRTWTPTATAIGDIPGLIQRLDYLAGLGVTCLWLMPFQPTPNRDDGYDITDYYGVDPRLGDARRLRRARPHRHRPRAAGDRRPGRQPHLRRASVVPGGAQRPRLAAARLVRLARRAVGRAEGARLPGQARRATGPTTRARPVLPAPLLLTSSPTSTRPTRRSVTRSRTSSASGSRWASRASAWTPCRPARDRRAARARRQGRAAGMAAPACARSPTAAAATRCCSAR